ncbi:phosphotransferase [Rossellomorea oryzaecorticis]|uniref:Phosphotransferase n=1 Tax=Rossellomorea oryzaecorticis TaxID=1396505 RepID=A0ABU9KCV4_9BACI
MTSPELRLKEMNWQLLNKEPITGVHAGSIYRITVTTHDNNRSTYIYKEFVKERNNEADVYKKLQSTLKPFSKLIKLWDSSPQAILMCDLHAPMKEGFIELPLENKKNLLKHILKRLADLHSLHLGKIADDLPVHSISSEWYEWGLDQMKRLCTRHKWAKPEWIQSLQHAYSKLGLHHYKIKSPLTLTHGDPHLENLFLLDEGIWFIDWEWAAMASPLRDITILLQDIYDPDLIQYSNKYYRDLLEAKGFPISKEDYRNDFNHLYIDHTTMMLAWEIEKYYKGYVSEERMKEITTFKIREINRVAKEALGE